MLRHDVDVLLVGDELLRGDRRDAHLAFIARALRPIGARVHAARVVGDDVSAIAAAVRESVAHARALIVTGGLGPTDDDVTREGVAEAIELPLEYHEDQWRVIEEFFATRGRTATEANRRQAHFPSGATVIPNTLGTAAGFSVTAGDTAVYVLPGPPLELQPMLETAVRPELARRFARSELRVETFRTIGIGESQLLEMMGAEAFAVSAWTVGWLPHVAGVDVVLTQRADAASDALDREAGELEARMRDVLGTKYFERGERAIARVVADLLVARGESVAAAESITGGTVARLFTGHPGSSACFLASAVAYADASKVELAGVRAETIESFGAVSEEVCTELAHGIRRRARATWGLATTGIAGPTGATPHKPIGLTFIGVAWEGGAQIRRVIYPGDRSTIRDRAAHGVIWLLYDQLRRRA